MIDYKLAKELKDAGFPQKGNGKPYSVVATLRDQDFALDGKENVYFPTLSELIKACGECLSHIKRLPVEGKEYWWAVSHCEHKEHEWGGNNLEEQGGTPEEAVAKLWLALNKK